MKLVIKDKILERLNRTKKPDKSIFSGLKDADKNIRRLIVFVKITKTDKKMKIALFIV